jgi:3-oxoacyl-[acyl-carrier protein] reductase
LVTPCWAFGVQLQLANTPSSAQKHRLMPDTNHLSLAGKAAVVTGSSSGIGRAIALELASAGAMCIVHAGSNRQGADEVARTITSSGGQARVVVCDITDTDKLPALVDDIWSTRPIDVWINNAGADVLTGATGKWSFQQKLHRLWQVDVAGTVLLSRLIGAKMKPRGSGVIINVGWDQAESGMAGDSGELFSATKGAIMAFTRSLAQSLAPQVRVNCVAPGWIKTQWGEGASQYWHDRARRESLADRWGTPEDVAHVVRFLASDAASFISGQIIPVNGGFRHPS